MKKTLIFLAALVLSLPQVSLAGSVYFVACQDVGVTDPTGGVKQFPKGTVFQTTYQSPIMRGDPLISSKSIKVFYSKTFNTGLVNPELGLTFYVTSPQDPFITLQLSHTAIVNDAELLAALCQGQDKIEFSAKGCTFVNVRTKQEEKQKEILAEKKATEERQRAVQERIQYNQRKQEEIGERNRLADKNERLKNLKPEREQKEIRRVKEENFNDIETKYRDQKEVWKFLKWGMTPDEVTTLMEHYDSANRIKESRDQDGCPDLFIGLLGSLHGPEIASYLYSLRSEFKTYKDVYGELYFYKNGLEGRGITLNKDDQENSEYIVKKLEEQFRGKQGKISKAKKQGFAQRGEQDFSFESESLVVFTYYDSYGRHGYVYYHNPKIVKEISSAYLDVTKKQKDSQRKQLDKRL